MNSFYPVGHQCWGAQFWLRGLILVLIHSPNAGGSLMLAFPLRLYVQNFSFLFLSGIWQKWEISGMGGGGRRGDFIFLPSKAFKLTYFMNTGFLF